jgi:YegS/Rv2252/BmrU family lipid kinase
VTRAAVVVVNPAAGGGRSERQWRGLREDLHRLGLVFDWALTSGPGGAVALARAAAEAGAGLVVAVGGDGTLNEVVNGVTREGEPGVTVGALLTGRGRDAARNLGLAADPRAAARRLVGGTDARLDLVRAEWPDGHHRYVVGAAGAGFDARVARRGAAAGGRGAVPYLLAVLATLSSHVAVTAEVRADGGRAWSGRLSAAIVANGPCYGAGMRIAPAADVTDGRLDLVVLGDLGRLELLRWLPTVYRGRHLACPKVHTLRARRVTVGGGAPLPVHVDGEAAPDTPAAFVACPGALRLRR